MILTTERLVLREFEDHDWRATLAYQVDPEYLRFYPWSYRTEMDVRAFVHMFIDWSRERPRKKYQVAITLRENNQLIGNCGIRMNQSYAQIAEMGYELDRRFWGQGYATEAASAMLSFGFEQLHLHRIWAYCIAENTASARVLEKIGMQYEGRQRESEWMKGQWWDTRLYAVLEREWREQLKARSRQVIYHQ